MAGVSYVNLASTSVGTTITSASTSNVIYFGEASVSASVAKPRPEPVPVDPVMWLKRRVDEVLFREQS